MIRATMMRPKGGTVMKWNIHRFAFCAVVVAVLCLAGLMTVMEAAGAESELRVVSDQTIQGFVYPESAAYEPKEGVLYVSEFGSVLKPKLKDGSGRICKVSVSGHILERQFLPLSPSRLNKPKGIWIQGTRLWVTDIDMVWLFDIETRTGKALPLPMAQFANDPVVINNVLYISDSETKKIYRIKPADYLTETKEPAVTVYGTELSFSPNGLYPARDGSLLVAGFSGGEQDFGVYIIEEQESFGTIVKNVGWLDGVAQLDDESLLMTDWKSGTLLMWNRTMGVKKLAEGFKGPADFCVVPQDNGMLVVVPDLVKSEIRLIRLMR
jgi:hypothetical protein